MPEDDKNNKYLLVEAFKEKKKRGRKKEKKRGSCVRHILSRVTASTQTWLSQVGSVREGGQGEQVRHKGRQRWSGEGKQIMFRVLSSAYTPHLLAKQDPQKRCWEKITKKTKNKVNEFKPALLYESNLFIFIRADPEKHSLKKSKPALSCELNLVV